MPEPRVLVKEIDISQRIPVPPGIAAVATLTSTKGAWDPHGNVGRGIGIPVLVSNETEFYNAFGIPDVNSDPMYFDIITYLKYADRLWVIRSGKGDAGTVGYNSAKFKAGSGNTQSPLSDVQITGNNGIGTPALNSSEGPDTFIIEITDATPNAEKYKITRMSNNEVLGTGLAVRESGGSPAGDNFITANFPSSPFSSYNFGEATDTTFFVSDRYFVVFEFSESGYVAYAGSVLRNVPSYGSGLDDGRPSVYDPNADNSSSLFPILFKQSGSASPPTVDRNYRPPRILLTFTGSFTFTVEDLNNPLIVYPNYIFSPANNYYANGLRMFLNTVVNATFIAALTAGDDFILDFGASAWLNGWDSSIAEQIINEAVSGANLLTSIKVKGHTVTNSNNLPILHQGIDTITIRLEITDITTGEFRLIRTDTGEVIGDHLPFGTDLSTGDTDSVFDEIQVKSPTSPYRVGDKFDMVFTSRLDLAWVSDLTFPTNELIGKRVKPYNFTTVFPNGITVFEGILLYAKNPGAWGNNLSFTITADPLKSARKKDGSLINSGPCVAFGAFILSIYDTGELVEQFPFATFKDSVDGFGRTAFLPSVLNSSNYLNAEISSEISSDPLFDCPIIGSSFPLAGGKDSTYIDVADRLAQMKFAIQQVEDEEVFDVTTFILGDWTAPLGSGYNPALLEEATRIAEARLDSIVIGSTQLESELASNIFDTTIGAVSIVNEQIALITGVGNRGSYAAIYSPHLQDFDSNNGNIRNISPTGYVAGIISIADINFKRWVAPAGWRRAVLDVQGVSRIYTKSERSVLFEKNINPIRVSKSRGIVVWGDKTLQVRPTALDQVGVRLLLTVLKPTVRKALEDFVFEGNDPFTRSEVKSLLESSMLDFVAGRGIEEFLVVVDERNNPPQIRDQQKLVAWIFIKPINSIRYIDAAVIITRSDVNLQILASQGGF